MYSAWVCYCAGFCGDVFVRNSDSHIVSPVPVKITAGQGASKLVVGLDFILADENMIAGIDKSIEIESGGGAYSVAPPDVIIALKRARMSAKDRGDIEGLQKLLESDGL